MAILARLVKRSVVLREDDESKNRKMQRGSNQKIKSRPKRMDGIGLSPSPISTKCATWSRTAKLRESKECWLGFWA